VPIIPDTVSVSASASASTVTVSCVHAFSDLSAGGNQLRARLLLLEVEGHGIAIAMKGLFRY
jgi:hypothetical protein